MLPQRFAVLAFLAAGLAAIANACAGDSTTAATAADGGDSSDASGTGVCPRAAPAAGAVCLAPEGTTCAFGACGTSIVECIGGTWRYGGNPPPRPPCPVLFPTAESPCPACWPAEVSCSYGSCFGADASVNATIATCPSGTWQLSYIRCATDAGADVQGDSGADVD